MILITGGSGLVGSHLIVELLKEGIQPKVLIRNEKSKDSIFKTLSLYSNKPDILFNSIHWVNGDINDRASLFDAFDDVEFVYHCAAKVSFEKGDYKNMLETNIRGTENIVDLCLEREIKKLVHVSSIAAIKGNNDSEIITEDSGWSEGHKLNYSYSKTKGELEVWRGITEGLNAVIVNPSVILGPGDWKSGSPRFFGTVNKGLKFYTRGVTGFVDVYDVVKIMILLMKSDIAGQRFIVNAENVSYELLFKYIAESLGVKAPSIYATPAMTNFAMYVDTLKSKLFFIKPLLTRDTARSAHSVKNYSSEKLLRSIDYKFTPLQQSIDHIAGIFLAENHK